MLCLFISAQKEAQAEEKKLPAPAQAPGARNHVKERGLPAQRSQQIYLVNKGSAKSASYELLVIIKAGGAEFAAGS